MTVKLSPRRINLFMECKRCFWLRVNEGVKRPSGPFPSLPGGMDGTIKDHFDRHRERGELPPEIQDESIDAVPLQDTDFLENARKWQTEPKYHARDLDIVLRGGVDDLLRRNGDDAIIVLDYKTRGYPPKDGVPEYYARQVNLYNLILRESGYRTAEHGLLLYYYPDQITESGDFLFHNEIKEVEVDIQAARDFLRKAKDTLEGPIPEHNSDCDFCDWNAANHERD